MTALTGAELLQGLSIFLNDWEPSTTTSAGAADGSTLIDTFLKRYEDNRLEGRFARITASGSNQYQVQTIESNAQATGTVEFNGVFPAQVGSGVTYQLHRYDPVKKFRALDEARYDAFNDAYILVYDESVTADGTTDTFTVPSSITEGPISVWEEYPLAALNVLWNFLYNADGANLDNWTATNCTASLQQQYYTDLVIPKYDWACTVIDVAASMTASYSQTVANMANDITASDAGGRQMAAGMWVYCEESGRVTISLEDDSTTTSSSTHSGTGWELLTLEKDIVQGNATTLTFSLNISSGGALKVVWNRAWLYYGDKQRMVERYNDQAFGVVRHDYNTHKVTLSRVPQRGHQLRFVGQGQLSELGTNTSTQVTNTMELTEQTARVLYAHAAQLLLEWEGLTANDVPEVFQRIQIVKERAPRLRQFGIQQPRRSVTSPYWV